MSKTASLPPPLILASNSPRRYDLLQSAGLRFEVDPCKLPEEQKGGEAPQDYARRMAQQKALDVAKRHHSEGDGRLVLGADTIVVLDQEIIGKPANRPDAESMLTRLSGRTHRVITGFCLVPPNGPLFQAEIVTEVTFKTLSSKEIEHYLDTNEWADKAGGYAVQGRAAFMVKTVNGSYTNVVGLPLCEVLETLEAIAQLGRTD